MPQIEYYNRYPTIWKDPTKTFVSSKYGRYADIHGISYRYLSDEIADISIKNIFG